MLRSRRMYTLYICLASLLWGPCVLTSYAKTLHRFQMNSPACKAGVPITINFDTELETTVSTGEVDPYCGTQILGWDALPLGKETNSICDDIASNEFGPNYETTYDNMYLTQVLYAEGILSAYADRQMPEYSDLKKMVFPKCGMVLYREKYTERRTWHKCDTRNCFIEGESTLIHRDGGVTLGMDQYHTKGMCLKVCKDLDGSDHYGNFGVNPARDCLILDETDCLSGYVGDWPHLGEAVRADEIDITPDGSCAYPFGQEDGPFLMSEAARSYRLKTQTDEIVELKADLEEKLMELEIRLNTLESDGLSALNEEEEKSPSFAISVAGLALSGTLTAVLLALCVIGMIARGRGAQEE